MTYLCVLRTGGEYNLDYVSKLSAGLRRAVSADIVLCCLTDAFDIPTSRPGIDFIPMRKKLPGWWAKMEMFRIDGPVLYFDLDTVICGNIDSLVSALESLSTDLLLIRDFGADHKWASGIIGWRQSRVQTYTKFMDDAARGRFETRNGCKLAIGTKTFRGDQEWLHDHVREYGLSVTAARDVQPGIYSYKLDLKAATECPPDASIVCLHGHPRPHELSDGHWLKRLWCEE
jgi:hypothetical protein